MPDLICEYYCEVGVREKLVASNKSAQASSPLEASLLQTVFEPSVLLRRPQEDRAKGMKFAPEVAMFAFPHGVRLATPEVRFLPLLDQIAFPPCSVDNNAARSLASLGGQLRPA